jgi:hypothetical protein
MSAISRKPLTEQLIKKPAKEGFCTKIVDGMCAQDNQPSF